MSSRKNVFGENVKVFNLWTLSKVLIVFVTIGVLVWFGFSKLGHREIEAAINADQQEFVVDGLDDKYAPLLKLVVSAERSELSNSFYESYTKIDKETLNSLVEFLSDKVIWSLEQQEGKLVLWSDNLKVYTLVPFVWSEQMKDLYGNIYINISYSMCGDGHIYAKTEFVSLHEELKSQTDIEWITLISFLLLLVVVCGLSAYVLVLVGLYWPIKSIFIMLVLSSRYNKFIQEYCISSLSDQEIHVLLKKRLHFNQKTFDDYVGFLLIGIGRQSFRFYYKLKD